MCRREAELSDGFMNANNSRTDEHTQNCDIIRGGKRKKPTRQKKRQISADEIKIKPQSSNMKQTELRWRRRQPHDALMDLNELYATFGSET